jgi:hypothetical protein
MNAGVPAFKEVHQPEDAPYDALPFGEIGALPSASKRWQFGKHRPDQSEKDGNAGAFQALPDPSDSDMGVFQLKPSQLRALVDHKSIDYLESLGGIHGL